MANLDSIAMLAATDGILPVDKPAGIAVHDALRTVKDHFNLVKLGHGGTLEPYASGVMLLLLGDATRFSSELMARNRRWEATIRLGRSTNTGDRYGDVIGEKDSAGVTAEAFAAMLKEFRGDVFQTLPESTAIKRHESESYETVPTKEEDRQTKLTHVFRIDVAEFANPLVKVEMLAAKGVSARALVRDMGEALGCGASVESLRRTAQGKFAAGDAIGFVELLKLDAVDFRRRVLPMAGALD